MNVRTRFAPSPTGYLHVGGARTALFNYLYAKAMKGSFILRIEDTDQERSSEESCQQMLESIKWLGLDWDEGFEKGGDLGPYRQSERLKIYKEHAKRLLTEEKAYRCFCTQDELEGKKKRHEAMGLPPVYDGKCRNLNQEETEKKLGSAQPFTVRFMVEPKGEIWVNDMIQGDVCFDTSLIGDFIILKSDGFPSYNFAVVVDDHKMNITHVIRGVGHLSNTPRQSLIFAAFGWKEPFWAHVSEIVGSDHKKLSKRHGAVSITAFREIGYPSQAFLNYMALLGWSPPNGIEYMSLNEIINQFDIVRCSKSPAMFDVFSQANSNRQGGKKTEKKTTDLNQASLEEFQNALFPKSKLNWVSNQTIRGQSEKDYLENIMPFVKASAKVPAQELKTSRLEKILLALRVYLDYYSQIGGLIKDFYKDEVSCTESAREYLLKDYIPLLREALVNNLKELSSMNDTDDTNKIKEAIKEAGKSAGVKGKDLFMGARAMLTGKTEGIELPVYIQLLGFERVLKRLTKT